MATFIQSSLAEHGKDIRGWLGVSIQDLTADLQTQFDALAVKGALVSEVVNERPAVEALFKRGDIIRTYDSHVVNDTRHLRSLVAESLPNASVNMQVFREGKQQELAVNIREKPKEVMMPTSAREVRGKHALTRITVKPSSFGEKGVEVIDVKAGSAASRAGIREGGIICEINRLVVKGVDNFQRLTSKLDAKDQVLFLLQRGRGTVFLSIAPYF